jgi:uncharacterized membrane protein
LRVFSFRPALSLRGRDRRGLSGFAGKPFHPPLTDIPIAAYVLVAVFDLISFVWSVETWARDFYRTASFVLIGGAVVSLLTALTGYLDWRTTEKGSQVRRTVNAHAWTMILVTLIVLANLALRWFGEWGDAATPGYVFVLSAVAGVLVIAGATLGGSLVFDYGFNVETSTDHPVWHQSETDVFPGQGKSA